MKHEQPVINGEENWEYAARTTMSMTNFAHVPSRADLNLYVMFKTCSEQLACSALDGMAIEVPFSSPTGYKTSKIVRSFS